jgi:hypothetical protein
MASAGDVQLEVQAIDWHDDSGSVTLHKSAAQRQAPRPIDRFALLSASVCRAIARFLDPPDWRRLSCLSTSWRDNVDALPWPLLLTKFSPALAEYLVSPGGDSKLAAFSTVSTARLQSLLDALSVPELAWYEPGSTTRLKPSRLQVAQGSPRDSSRAALPVVRVCRRRLSVLVRHSPTACLPLSVCCFAQPLTPFRFVRQLESPKSTHFLARTLVVEGWFAVRWLWQLCWLDGLTCVLYFTL